MNHIGLPSVLQFFARSIERPANGANCRIIKNIELRDDDRTCQPVDHLESRGKLRPALKRVSALASLDFGESIYDVAASAPANRTRAVPSIKYPTPRGTPLVAGSGVAI